MLINYLVFCYNYEKSYKRFRLENFMTEKTKELNNWVGEKLCKKAVAALNNNRFKAEYCPNAEEAKKRALEIAAGATTVGFGGSRTITDLEIAEALTSNGATILNHGNPELSPEEKMALMKQQQTCSVFFSSANAITLDGAIVNIDGVGNRVSAMIFGPEKVIIVAGRNKLVDGDICDAIKRIKALACPPNTYRLGKKTPCAETGICVNCNSPERICNVTTILEKCPRLTDIYVLVVNEEMGF